MILSAESQKTVDLYLAVLRKQLFQLMEDDANDIVEEIRTHIPDKTSGDAATLASTLAALGTPEELANRYRTDDLLKRAQVTRSPFLSLRSLFRWATLSFLGLAVFLVAVVGYGIGGAFVMFAALKLIWPHATGLWKNSYPDGSSSLYLTCSTGQPPHSQELLGGGMKLALVGVGIGIACSLALTRLMAKMLYGVSPSDPVTFLTIAALLLLIAMAACYIPARRAMGVDPAIALRYD